MKNFTLGLLTIVAFLFSNLLLAQDKYELNIKLDNYSETNLFLGYHLGGKQYLTDTTQVNENGEFVFSKTDTLKAGLYLIVMEPENRYFEFIIDEDLPKFNISVDAINPFESIKFKNSEINSNYYDYLHSFSDVRKKYENLTTKQNSVVKDSKEFKDIEDEKEAVKNSSFDYQNEIIAKNPQSFLSLILKSNKNVDMPTFEGTDEEIQLERYHFAKKHYFDYLNLKDDRLLRTPFLDKKLDYYIEKMTPKHPDSVIVSVDRILDKMVDTTELYQYYVVKFINKYANSKFVGFDAVYVHMADKYYATGRAPWTDAESLSKITKQADVLRNLLIGKIAPDIILERKDKSRVSLHSVEKDFTVLFFWSPNCGHCKKSMPAVIEFYNEFKDKGVEIFAVCTMLTDKAKECWEYIETKETGMQNWMNLVDPYLRSKYKQIYDVKSTPTIYVLDKDKKIVSKRIGSEQLEDVMNRLIEIENMNAAEDNK